MITLAAAGARLGVAVAEPLLGGGSGAATASGTDRRGRPVVIKLLRSRPGVVDGHDLATFRAKQRQVRLLGDLAPQIAARYPATIEAVHGDGWSAYVFDRIAGVSALDAVAAVPPADGARLLARTWSVLCDEGYSHAQQRTGRNLWQAAYLDRIPRRMNLLREHLPELVDADHLTVNGQRIPGLKALHAQARAAGRLFERATLAAPVHGDLNLGNMILPHDADPQAVRLIDPRGVLAVFDPLYDLAKMLFSLTLFEQAMTGGYTLTRDAPGTWRVTPATVNPHVAAAGSMIAAAEVFASCASAAGLNTTDWTARWLLAHAAHVLAEAPCRLSDRAEPLPVRRNRAAGLLLCGLLLMHDLLERLRLHEPVDATHLAALNFGG